MKALWLAMAAAMGMAQAAPVKVELKKTTDGWQMLRGGKPYRIKGAGGGGSMQLLKSLGGNSNRTWGVEEAGALLDEAQRQGMTVCVGIWLAHLEHGMDWNDPEQVYAQQERVREAVLKFRDHPALLMWCLGNEMEGHGNHAAIWSAINNMAAMAKRLDPNHPTMTIIAELGDAKVRNIHRLCPDIDIVGVNSYGGASSVPDRYRAQGGTKPIVLTEFGPPGQWESGKTAWDAPMEMTSDEKADWYRRGYEAFEREPLSLGSYAFLWGHKMEATPTWFGMLLPDGSRLASADTMSGLWTGKPPANRCPVIRRLTVDAAEVEPGATVTATLDASDREGDTLKAEWVLLREAGSYHADGRSEAELPSFPEAIVSADAKGAKVAMPKDPGGYRLYTYVRDGKGGAATANVPVLVRGEAKPPETPKAALPLTVYDEAGRAGAPYAPSGWMGNAGAMKVREDCPDGPFAGRTCIRVDYTAAGDWAGVLWQSPANDWGDRAGGWNLTGARRLAFRCRGAKGGEVVSFQVGGIGKDKEFHDTTLAKLEDVRLTAEWQEYRINLAGQDLSRIKTGFGWVVRGQGSPVTFYLDDIRYEQDDTGANDE